MPLGQIAQADGGLGQQVVKKVGLTDQGRRVEDPEFEKVRERDILDIGEILEGELIQVHAEPYRQAQGALHRVVEDFRARGQDPRLHELVDKVLQGLDAGEVDPGNHVLVKGGGKIEEIPEVPVYQGKLGLHEVLIRELTEPREGPPDHLDQPGEVETAEIENLLEILVTEFNRRPSSLLKEGAFQHDARNLGIGTQVGIAEGGKERQVDIDVVLELRARIRQRSETELSVHEGHAGREIDPELPLRPLLPTHRDLERPDARTENEVADARRGIEGEVIEEEIDPLVITPAEAKTGFHARGDIQVELGITIDGKPDIVRPDPEIETDFPGKGEVTCEGNLDEIILSIHKLPGKPTPFAPQGRQPVLAEVIHQAPHRGLKRATLYVNSVITRRACNKIKPFQLIYQRDHLSRRGVAVLDGEGQDLGRSIVACGGALPDHNPDDHLVFTIGGRRETDAVQRARQIK